MAWHAVTTLLRTPTGATSGENQRCGASTEIEGPPADCSAPSVDDEHAPEVDSTTPDRQLGKTKAYASSRF